MKFTAQDVSFSADFLVVVTGCNPEMADMSNPRGDLFGDAWSVYAWNEHGARVALFVGMNDDGKVKAGKLAAALTARAAGGKLPVAFDSWKEDRPVYGSDAYVAAGGDADEIAREREEEAWSLYSDLGHATF